MKKHLLVLLSITLFSIGCYKDTDNTLPPKVIIETTEVFINTSISGSVLNLEGNLVSDYILMVNDKLSVIPADYFLLEQDDLKKKGQTIHVIKDDKQIGIRTQLLVENDINHMEIQQHPEYEQKIIFDNDSKINFTKSLVADFSSTKWADGYEGSITADFVHIESTNSLTPVGYNSFSDLLAIDSRGGFYLSLQTANGDEILSNPESPIIIKTDDVDDDINGLFVFDREEELWILVTEFTPGDEVEILGEGYYTFANYTPGVFVQGKVTKEDKPVAYQPMNWDLASLSNQICATEKGNWIALLPEQESIRINLLNPCNETLQTESLDVDVVDINHQNLTVSESINYQQLDITILDCNEEVVSAPNLNINNGESTAHYVFTEDYTNRWIAVCDEFGIAAENEITGEVGPEVSWSTEIDGGLDALTDCSELEQGYSYIKIRDDQKVYPAFEVKEEAGRTILQSEDGNVKFIFKGSEEGMYNVDEVNVLINDSNFGDKGYYIQCENSVYGCGINNFNVTHYGTGGGGMMRATFSGVLWMQTLSPSVAGDFEVEGVIVIK